MRTALLERLETKDSSLIEYVVFAHREQKLTVKFIRGKHANKVKTYKGIPSEAFETIVNAKSKGKAVLKVLSRYRQESSSFFQVFKAWFNSNIRSPY